MFIAICDFKCFLVSPIPDQITSAVYIDKVFFVIGHGPLPSLHIEYTAKEISIMYFFFLGIAPPQSQILHSCISERFIYSQDLSTYFPAAG